MDTKVYYLDERNPDIGILEYAAGIIKNGGTVVFPTETVYGLGANALDPKAAEEILKAKGRPRDNPLIVHFCDRNIGPYVKKIPKDALKLMDAFWPGPLTIILEKSSLIPGVVTAGLDSVAIRMPSNTIAHELIKLSGVPIAAPSANISGKPSPTDVTHVINDMMGRVDVILGGGRTDVGLESTVVDMTGSPVILRPGRITFEELRSIIDDIYIDPGVMEKPDLNLKPKSPGMKYRHYAPAAAMHIVRGDIENVKTWIIGKCEQNIADGLKVGILATDQTLKSYKCGCVLSMGDREHPDTIASLIFDRLREFDNMNVDMIYAESIEESGIGFAIMNRMRRAAGYNIIDV